MSIIVAPIPVDRIRPCRTPSCLLDKEILAYSAVFCNGLDGGPPQGLNWQGVQTRSEGYAFGASVEYYGAMEAVAGQFGEGTQALEVLGSDRGSRFVFDAHHASGIVFENEETFETRQKARRVAAGSGQNTEIIQGEIAGRMGASGQGVHQITFAGLTHAIEEDYGGIGQGVQQGSLEVSLISG